MVVVIALVVLVVVTATAEKEEECPVYIPVFKTYIRMVSRTRFERYVRQKWIPGFISA